MTLVRVPREIAPLVPRFLANRQRELDELREALAAGDHPRVRATAHAIKGTAGGYHFIELAELARRLEDAARTLDTPATLRCLDEMTVHLASVQVVFTD